MTPIGDPVDFEPTVTLKVPQPDGMRRSAETIQPGDIVASVSPRDGWVSTMAKGTEHTVTKVHDDWVTLEDQPNSAFESGAFVVIHRSRPVDPGPVVSTEYSSDGLTWVRVDPRVNPPGEGGWKRLVFADGSKGPAKRRSNPYAHGDHFPSFEAHPDPAALRLEDTEAARRLVTAIEAQAQVKRDREATPEHNPVDHPAHYRLASGVEVIDLTEQLDFLRGNAVKYLARAGRKDGADELEDLRKAAWYANRAVTKLEAERA